MPQADRPGARRRSPARVERILGWAVGLGALTWIVASVSAALVLSGSPDRVIADHYRFGFEGPGPASARFVFGVAVFILSLAGRAVALGGLAASIAVRARRSAAAFAVRMQARP